MDNMSDSGPAPYLIYMQLACDKLLPNCEPQDVFCGALERFLPYNGM
jgi:hypothetical protein